MIHKYGPMVRAVVLILQAYKASIYVCEDIEQGCEGRIQDLTKVFMTLYNEEFFSEGDRIDSYLERLFDILEIPTQPLLRRRCADHILDYLKSARPILEVIQSVLHEKKSYEDDREKYLRENK